MSHGLLNLWKSMQTVTKNGFQYGKPEEQPETLWTICNLPHTLMIPVINFGDYTLQCYEDINQASSPTDNCQSMPPNWHRCASRRRPDRKGKERRRWSCGPGDPVIRANGDHRSSVSSVTAVLNYRRSNGPTPLMGPDWQKPDRERVARKNDHQTNASRVERTDRIQDGTVPCASLMREGRAKKGDEDEHVGNWVMVRCWARWRNDQTYAREELLIIGKRDPWTCERQEVFVKNLRMVKK